MKKSIIEIAIDLNENKVPKKMIWNADDGGVKDAPANAMLLSLWDPKEQNAMKIDLWTDEMKVDEMKVFFHQTLLTMADTFERSTGEKNLSEDLRDYCAHFADKLNLFQGEE